MHKYIESLPLDGTRTEDPESPISISGKMIRVSTSSLLITLSAISPILPGEPVAEFDLLFRLASNNLRVASFLFSSSSLDTSKALGSKSLFFPKESKSWIIEMPLGSFSSSKQSPASISFTSVRWIMLFSLQLSLPKCSFVQWQNPSGSSARLTWIFEFLERIEVTFTWPVNRFRLGWRLKKNQLHDYI